MNGNAFPYHHKLIRRNRRDLFLAPARRGHNALPA
jgi:hypothetical protein